MTLSEPAFHSTRGGAVRRGTDIGAINFDKFEARAGSGKSTSSAPTSTTSGRGRGR
jgi:hypothetical protein